MRSDKLPGKPFFFYVAVSERNGATGVAAAALAFAECRPCDPLLFDDPNPMRIFRAMDADHDGTVTLEEMARAVRSLTQRDARCPRVTCADKIFLWRTRRM